MNTIESNSKTRPTCLDFFAGSGLASEALSGVFETLWANDVCEKKAKVYTANHNIPVFHLGTIENVSPRELPSAMLSWGSFPCQDLSLAGNLSGISGSRSGMFWEWLRVMDGLEESPPMVVAENVLGLLSANGGANYLQLHDALVSRGYEVGAIVLDAIHWVPQSRKRVFVVAAKSGLDLSPFKSETPTWCHPAAVQRVGDHRDSFVYWNLPTPPARKVTFDDIVDLDAECFAPDKRDKTLALIPPHHLQKLQSEEFSDIVAFPGYRRIRSGRQCLELRFDRVAGCLRTPSGGSSRQYVVLRNGTSLDVRLLTVAEAAALMGARKDYALPGSYNDGYRAMGDAVAVPAVAFLAENLLVQLSELYGVVNELRTSV